MPWRPLADFSVVNVNYTDPHICEKACIANADCVAWTYVTRPPLVASCCLKHAGFGYVPGRDTCTSGVRKPQPARPAGPSPLEEKLGALSPDDLSPREALQALYDLKASLET